MAARIRPSASTAWATVQSTCQWTPTRSQRSSATDSATRSRGASCRTGERALAATSRRAAARALVWAASSARGTRSGRGGRGVSGAQRVDGRGGGAGVPAPARLGRLRSARHRPGRSATRSGRRTSTSTSTTGFGTRQRRLNPDLRHRGGRRGGQAAGAGRVAERDRRELPRPHAADPGRAGRAPRRRRRGPHRPRSAHRLRAPGEQRLAGGQPVHGRAQRQEASARHRRLRATASRWRCSS